MGIRIITPDSQTNEVLSFAKHKGNTVWLWCNLHTLQHNLAYGKRSLIKSKSQFIIEFTPDAFRKLALPGNTFLQDFVKRIKKGNALLSQQPLVLDAAMQQCISSVTNYPGAEDTKKIYLYARVLELLWLQQENYLRKQHPHPVFVKTEYDKERIVFARDYLLTHMDAPPTLIRLAAIAGINEFKLKRGFKELFNQTVFAYLADVRLEMARRALAKKEKTVTRIAFELGYASLQHFSMAFKKKFGVSPNQVK